MKYKLFLHIKKMKDGFFAREAWKNYRRNQQERTYRLARFREYLQRPVLFENWKIRLRAWLRYWIWRITVPFYQMEPFVF
jgi:hypothetical protein